MKRNVVAERYKFHSRKQNADAYVTSLRELVKTCEFGTFEDEMLRDQIVEKCYLEQLKQRLLAHEELDLAKTLRIANLELEPSPWVSNLVVVPKASGGLRVCCDFRELNKAIVRGECYVLSKVEDTLDSLNGSKYFAKIDARSGFFQLTLSEECRHLTTFITNKRVFSV